MPTGEKIQTGCVQRPLALPSSPHVARPYVGLACNGNACVCVRARKTPSRVRNAGRPRPTPRSCGRRVLTPLGCRSPPLCVSAAATGLGGGRNDWWTLRRVRRRGDLARQSCGGRRTERYGRRCRRETISAQISTSVCLPTAVCLRFTADRVQVAKSSSSLVFRDLGVGLIFQWIESAFASTSTSRKYCDVRDLVMAHLGTRLEEFARDVNVARITVPLVGMRDVVARRDISLSASHRKWVTF